MAAVHPFLDHPGPIPFAHRGGASDAPENTLAAFERAVALGYRYLETDVHATRDGVLLAFHDDRLDRVTDRTGIIAQLEHAVVATARVAGREPIPLLEDLLGAWSDVRVNIDAKDDGAVGPLVDVIRRTKAIERVCVGSFSASRLARIRAALGPGLCTSLGPDEVRALRLASWGARPLRRRVTAGGARCVQIPVRSDHVPLLDRRLLRTSKELGLAVHVWTIDDPAEMERLLDLGVDGLMTDRPAVLRDVLVARGAWFARSATDTMPA